MYGVDELEVPVYEYDGNGNLAAETDADSCRTEYTCNALDLATSIHYNEGNVVAYDWDSVGDQTALHSPARHQ